MLPLHLRQDNGSSLKWLVEVFPSWYFCPTEVCLCVCPANSGVGAAACGCPGSGPAPLHAVGASAEPLEARRPQAGTCVWPRAPHATHTPTLTFSVAAQYNPWVSAQMCLTCLRFYPRECQWWQLVPTQTHACTHGRMHKHTHTLYSSRN